MNSVPSVPQSISTFVLVHSPHLARLVSSSDYLPIHHYRNRMRGRLASSARALLKPHCMSPIPPPSPRLLANLFTRSAIAKVEGEIESANGSGKLIRIDQVRYASSNLRMPAMSPTMTEGGIAGWKKAEGEAFTTGDVLLEIVSLSLISHTPHLTMSVPVCA